MSVDKDTLDNLSEKISSALTRLKEISGGRIYRVGTKVKYKGKLGVVTELNKSPKDPAGSTVDLKLEDGTTTKEVDVDSPNLELFRA